ESVALEPAGRWWCGCEHRRRRRDRHAQTHQKCGRSTRGARQGGSRRRGAQREISSALDDRAPPAHIAITSGTREAQVKTRIARSIVLIAASIMPLLSMSAHAQTADKRPMTFLDAQLMRQVAVPAPSVDGK